MSNFTSVIKLRLFFSYLKKSSGQIVYDSMFCHSDRQVEAETFYSVIPYLFWCVTIKQKETLQSTVPNCKCDL